MSFNPISTTPSPTAYVRIGPEFSQTAALPGGRKKVLFVEDTLRATKDLFKRYAAGAELHFREPFRPIAPEAYFNAGSIVIATGPDFHEMDDAMRRRFHIVNLRSRYVDDPSLQAFVESAEAGASFWRNIVLPNSRISVAAAREALDL